MGWTSPGRLILWPEAVDLFLPDGGLKRAQNDQRIFSLDPVGWLTRYHARLWQVGDQVIAAAHLDSPRFRPPGHAVRSFEAAEQLIAQHFSWPPGAFNVRENSYWLGNSQTRPALNDGYATVVTP